MTGPDEAKQQGLGIVSGKLPELVGQIRDLYSADERLSFIAGVAACVRSRWSAYSS